ncbi:Uncharacterised protein g8415 [Pycnogonum litorale]
MSLRKGSNISSAVQSLPKVAGWKTLILVSNIDLLKNSDYSSLDVIILADYQLSLCQYEITRNLNLKYWTETLRLAAAFLFVIQNGAELFYLTDDRLFLPPSSEFETDQDDLRLIYPYNSSCVNHSLLYNPLIHFGQPVEPYGWIRNCGKYDYAGHYYVLNKTYPGVKHFIVNNNINTKVSSDSRYGVDTVAPPVVLSPGLYTPFLFTNTFFSYETFWGLFTGRFKNTKPTQILSSYWMQTLIKYVNADVMFDTMKGSKPNKIRNVSNNIDEIKFGNYLNAMTLWKCQHKQLVNCIKDLSKHLLIFDNLYHDGDDSSWLSLWLKDLIKVGYRFPNIVKRRSVDLINKGSSDILLFHPSEIRFKSESSLPLANITRLIATLREVCGDDLSGYNFESKLSSTFKPMFPNLLMIITFNLKHIQVIPLLEIIYKVQFPNVIICANGEDNREIANERRYSFYSTKNYSFVNVTNSPECISRVLKLGYKVSGIIHIQDDIVFNYWNVMKWNWTKLWSLPISQTLNLFSPNNFKRHEDLWWYPADSFVGVVEVLHLLKTSTNNGTTRNRCRKNLIKLHGATYKYSYGLCDIFYIPVRLAPSFSEIVGEFANRDVWLEIAIPNTLSCIEPRKEHVTLPIGQVPNANRQAWNAYKRYVKYLSKSYYHPFKLQPLLHDDIDRRNVFCKNVVKQIIKFW